MERADEAAVLQAYRSLPAPRRREVAAASTPQLKAQLVRIEREMALGRSPGAMAAVLTEGRVLQPRTWRRSTPPSSGWRPGGRRSCC
ncbi:hypothetical protein [Streptomyces sp. NPDC018045]|uniref:hypothetical protein n=1 Tax=Streptomyces sp. NPDC018045 TaxID=3365037 RepID=UPI0037B85B4F